MKPFYFKSSVKSAGTIVLLCATAITAGCSKSKVPTPQAKVAEVGVFTVVPEVLNLSTELPGRTAAYQVAEVRPQVGGLIEKRLFIEGGDVKPGSSLYQIDAASYQAAVNSANAVLARARANLLATGPKLARYKELVAIDGVSRQEYDDAVAANEQAKADVELATAALDLANINLRYTKVSAPIGGRIGRSSVTPGALVTANQAGALATVQQLDPIYVDLTQTSAELLRLKHTLECGELKQAGGQARVHLLLGDGSKYAESGKLQFSDVSVDTGTGNVTLRALFPNPKHELLPGMFVRAVLDTGIDEKGIAVPQQGVSRNAKGEATALVLNRDGKVEQRVLITGDTRGDKWLVKSGLAAGDRVIVEGLQKVRPGAHASVAKTGVEAVANGAGGAIPRNEKNTH